jgi:hypothetical protein
LRRATQSSPGRFDAIQRPREPRGIGDRGGSVQALGPFGVDQHIHGRTGTQQENIAVERRHVMQRRVVHLGLDTTKLTLVSLVESLADRSERARVPERFLEPLLLLRLLTSELITRARSFGGKFGSDLDRCPETSAHEAACDL